MSNKVIAISGYPGSGKTTVSESLISLRGDLIYFDFGYLFRPLTFYLFNELKLTEDDIREMVNNNLLRDKIKFSYMLDGNKVKIGINNHYYSDEELFSLKMNIDTITVGTIIGDSLTNELREIVDDLKKSGNVLLNARRPVQAYPDLDYHIFLKSSFEERVKRKMLMNNESYEVTKAKLFQRDIKEEKNGFWEIYDFTRVIDTTNLSKDEVMNAVLAIIDSPKITFTYINNLTLVLGSYVCNKNCPYCIAKNNMKFSNEDRLDTLSVILDNLKSEGIRFNRFVLSGNGEPSLYGYDELLKIREALLENLDLFNFLRIHSSGNIFFEEEKLSLFSSLLDNVEFEILRVSLDSKIDKQILGYKENYLESILFKTCKSVKCDIAFTDYLDFSNIREDIDLFMMANPSISKIRFKKLLVGDSDMTKQALWVKKHSLSDNDILKIIRQFGLIEFSDGYRSLDGKIVYMPNGNYDNDIVISNGMLEDYNCNRYNAKTLKRKFGG